MLRNSSGKFDGVIGADKSTCFDLRTKEDRYIQREGCPVSVVHCILLTRGSWFQRQARADVPFVCIRGDRQAGRVGQYYSLHNARGEAHRASQDVAHTTNAESITGYVCTWTFSMDHWHYHCGEFCSQLHRGRMELAREGYPKAFPQHRHHFYLHLFR